MGRALRLLRGPKHDGPRPVPPIGRKTAVHAVHRDRKGSGSMGVSREARIGRDPRARSMTFRAQEGDSLRAKIDSLRERASRIRVEGSPRMRRKLDRESKVLAKALEGKGLTTKRRQGMENNVRGMLAEVDAVEQLPGVVAMGKRFYECVEAKRRKGGRGRWPAVEVDIVAHDGCTWVEVKSQHTFSVSSAQWIGRGKRYKGLKQQAEDLLRLAACPCNLVQWKSPRIAFYFAGGVGPDVAAELRRMGAWVFESTDGGQIDMKTFPPSPERLTSAVLDVTALSALVSALSNGGTSLPEVRNWATRSPWDKCFAQEIASPLLQELEPLLEDRELLTPSSSVNRFEKIVSQIAGPSETSRWIELQRKLTVVDESKLDHSPLDGLDMLQPCQRASLKVAESCAALLLTANRRAVRAASDAGICIPAHQHRPVWLVGV